LSKGCYEKIFYPYLFRGVYDYFALILFLGHVLLGESLNEAFLSKLRRRRGTLCDQGKPKEIKLILRVYENNPQMRAINKAVEFLRSGGLVVYPTDTIYGLGCDLHNKKALEKIFRIKGDG